MEQRPETPSPVVLGAGTDPTHIPGLDTLEPDEPETAAAEPADPESASEKSETSEPSEKKSPVSEDSDGEERAEESPADADTAPSADTDEDEEAEDADEETTPEGPSFDVFDHRSSIVADGNGVVFRLDDTEARFPWSEIGSVEVGASRFGRRFEVAVGTTDHRRFEAEVIASSKQRLREWTTQLDAVLDAWFEDDGK